MLLQTFGQRVGKHSRLPIYLMKRALEALAGAWRSLEVSEHPAGDTPALLAPRPEICICCMAVGGLVEKGRSVLDTFKV